MKKLTPLQTLENIVLTHQHADVHHKDGRTDVDVQTAHVMLAVYNALTPSAQIAFATFCETRAAFARMVDFAWKQVTT